MARPRDPSEEPTRVTARGEREHVEVVEEGGPPPWWRENWWIWLLVLAAGVIAVIVLLFLLGDDDEDEAADGQSVPSVIGLGEQEARDVLTDAGFEVAEEAVDDEAPEGEVVAQEPEAGTELEEGGTVTIDVSRGPPETVTETETETTTETETEPAETETAEPETTEMPDTVGQDHIEAGAAADDAGLLAQTFPVASDETAGTVVAQNPDPGTQLDEGERVRLNVSTGTEELASAQVPDVTGPAVAEALRRCREANFTCRIVDRDAPSQEEVGEVIDQRPAAGASATELDQLTLFVGR